ncbi:hypothetical protein ACFWU3_29635 [Streptomyces sp. NPDC058685]|uniref:hypothetical protein n=1 Tax=Streptomyces sp. NPDC058685 TaxID=3346598 RepID=UPI0036526889
MDGELIAAIAAVGVGVVGTSYAAWQAHIAKSAARLAEEQATAAKEQVALMRRQIEGEEGERFEARGPQFAIEDVSVHTASDPPYVSLTLRQTAGPALDTVLVSASSADGAVEGMRGGLNLTTRSGYDQEEELDIGPMATGGEAVVGVLLFFPNETALITLELECRSRLGEVWERSYSRKVSWGDRGDRTAASPTL